MNVVEQQRNIDIQVCLKILRDNENLYATRQVSFENYRVIFSSRYSSVQFFNNASIKAIVVISFDTIFQSFIDPERPTEEEFVMFKLQHGVDWIVEPLKLSSEGITK